MKAYQLWQLFIFAPVFVQGGKWRFPAMPVSNGMMATNIRGGWDMLSDVAEFVVQGITVEGDVFQPPDWAERLCETLSGAEAGGGKVYPDYVRLIMVGGVASMVVQVLLQRENAHAFEMIKQYIAKNRLVVRSGRGSRDAEHSGPLRTFGRERRNPKRNIW